PLRPSPGKPVPRLVETPGGMLNSIGLQNIGVQAFLGDRLPALRAAGARVVANFWGDSPEEFAECAARLDGAPGVVALELNASSPNRPEWGSILATDPQTLAAIVRAVRARVRAPLWVKLSPNVGDITRVGRAAAAEGADALTASNTLRTCGGAGPGWAREGGGGAAAPAPRSTRAPSAAASPRRAAGGRGAYGGGGGARAARPRVARVPNPKSVTKFGGVSTTLAALLL